MIVYCHCAFADVTPRPVRTEVLRRLCEAGIAFERVPDLCELAARRDPLLTRIAEGGNATIIACYPRTVKWLFAYGGAPLPDGGAEILNMREESPEAIARRLPHDGPAHAESLTPDAVAEALEARTAGQWIPWFPLIDRDRCKDCHQCLNFCLFGVYTLSDDGKAVVENPANCKTNCPACARICPNVAIIFPKYKASPINGDEVSAEDTQREKVKVDPAALVRGDLHAALRERSQRARARFSTEMDEERAASEQKMCACMANELQKQLGIPAEVLASLSIDEIREKLHTAKRGHSSPSDGTAGG